MKYRADIDGLRSIAILPVILFHAGYSLFSGGFIGVDVFFVISGYLITKIISSEIKENKFSITIFYKKRIDRLLPVLLAVLTFTLITGWFLLTQNEYKSLSQSVVSSILFSSNIYFWITQDYFSASAQTLPLLHTWSLAVEEQFYIFFPLLMIAIYKLGFSSKKSQKTILLPIFLASLLVACITTYHSQLTAFYMLPFRAWELLIGSFLALNFIPATKSKFLANALSLNGLLLIAAAVFTFDKSVPFPGAAALLPTIGAALIIYSGSAHVTVAKTILESPPAVFFGKISYSLYMWHWPIYVFFNLYFDFNLSTYQRISMVATALVVSYFSWLLIEKKTRGRFVKAPTTKAFAYAGASMTAIALAGMVIVFNQGFPARLSEQAILAEKSATDYSPHRLKCHTNTTVGIVIEYNNSCILGENTKPDTVVWSDSHGVELAAAIGELYKQRGKSLRELTASGCPPSLGYNTTSRPDCAAYNQRIFDSLIADHDIKHVVITAFYGSPSYHDSWGDFESGFSKAIELLKASGKNIIINYPLPYYTSGVPQTMARAKMLEGIMPPPYITTEQFKTQNEYAISYLDKIARSDSVHLIESYKKICFETCEKTIDNHAIYFDGNHISMVGARLFAKDFVAITEQTMLAKH